MFQLYVLKPSSTKKELIIKLTKARSEKELKACARKLAIRMIEFDKKIAS
jgi:hypothetical protein